LRDLLFDLITRRGPIVLIALAVALSYWSVTTKRESILTTEQRIAAVMGWAPELLGSAAAIGLVVMLVIESIKAPIRASFHRRRIKHWLGDYEGSQTKVFDRFLRLMAPRYANDMLALPLEQLCAQIGGVVESIISNPRADEEILFALGGPGAGTEVKQLLIELERFKEPKTPYEGTASTTRDDIALIDARNVVGSKIQRHLDSFQIHVRSRWASRLRWFAVLSGLVLASGGARAFHVGGGSRIVTIAVIAAVGLIGGLVSSPMHNAVSLLERRSA